MRAPRWAVTAFLVAVVLLTAATVGAATPLWVKRWLVDRPLALDALIAGVPYDVLAAGILLGGLAAAFAFSGAGLFIAMRRPRDGFAAFVAAALLLRSVGFIASFDEFADPATSWSGVVYAFRVLDAICAPLFLFVFPNGRFVPRIGAVVVAAWAGWCIGTLAVPEANPVLRFGEPWATIPGVGLALFGLAAQAYRYRNVSTPHQRVQTRWVTYGLSVYVVVFAVQFLLPYAFPVLERPGTAARFWYIVAAALANDLAALLVAATIAIAVLRAHLFDIDLIISRTIAYAAATAVLAAAFGAISLSAQFVVAQLTGHRSDLVSAAVAVLIAGAFAPLKGYFQLRLDRRLRPAR